MVRGRNRRVVKSWAVAAVCAAFEYVILLLLVNSVRTLTYVLSVSLAAFFVSDAAAHVLINDGSVPRVRALTASINGLLGAFVLFCAVVVVSSVRFVEPQRFVPNLEYFLAFCCAILVEVTKTYARRSKN